jgi:microcystin-dependent protein
MANPIAVPGTVVASGSLTTPGGAQGVQGLQGSSAADVNPVGTILMYGSTTAPAGWMVCDGSAISRATYPALYALIGTSFGAGDGSTTFNLPDLRGRVGVGAGQGASLTNRVLAASGGEEAHVLSIAELAAHTHSDAGHTHPLSVSQNWQARLLAVSAGSESIAGYPVTSNTGTGVASLANTGSNGAHNTMQPFVVVAFIIKVSMGGGPTATAPIADTTQDGLLRKVSGLTTDFVDGTNHCQGLVAAIQPTIWSARLRSVNSTGNPTFEIDQRLSGGSNIASGVFTADRWMWSQNAATAKFYALGGTPAVDLPGTSFRITNKFLAVTVLTQQATLAAAEHVDIQQTIEGPVMRELADDVHSISLLVRTNVAAGLKFGVALRDNTAVRSLTKLCTIPSANVWTLIQLPNIPVWSSGGVYGTTPGTVGYLLNICFGAGSAMTSPANDTWQNGNFLGAAGQDNFASKPVNSELDIAFIQHEPGALCTTLIDKPFTQNLDECLRYYQKTYDYETVAGTATWAGSRSLVVPSGGTAAALGPLAFTKPMAQVPTITIWNPNTGASGSIRDGYYATDRTGASAGYPGKTGFGYVNYSTAPAGPTWFHLHFTADTSW